jgi:hypothetical protein
MLFSVSVFVSNVVMIVGVWLLVIVE